MKKQLSTRDLKLISGYLDGQLNARQRARLEARLDKKPELGVALSELRHTRKLLRSVPRMRVPRNFTVTPEMVRARRRAEAQPYPMFRLASAIASLFLVAVVVGDLLVGSPRLASVSVREVPVSGAVEQQVEEIAPQEEMVAAPAAEPEIMLQEMPEEMIQDTEVAESVALEAEVSVAAEAESESLSNDLSEPCPPEVDEAGSPMVESMKVAEDSTATEEAPLMMEAPAPESEAESSDEQDLLGRAEEAYGDGERVEGLSQKALTEALEDTSQAPMPEAESQVEPREGGARISRFEWTFFRYVEVVLAVIAVGTGGLAYYFRYRK